MNDILAPCRNEEEHLDHVRILSASQRLRAKYVFGVPEVLFLVIWSTRMVFVHHPRRSKRSLTIALELRQFLSVISFYTACMSNCDKIQMEFKAFICNIKGKAERCWILFRWQKTISCKPLCFCISALSTILISVLMQPFFLLGY